MNSMSRALQAIWCLDRLLYIACRVNAVWMDGYVARICTDCLCSVVRLFCRKGTPAWAEAQHWEYLSSMINKELNQVFTADSSGSLGQYEHLRNHYSRKRLPVEFPPPFKKWYTSARSPFICRGRLCHYCHSGAWKKWSSHDKINRLPWLGGN